ncbi:MAG: hypothetical protein JWP14_1237 [Frankiales bacterium]|nr:hypothetical protein [Frankiales bacterium]
MLKLQNLVELARHGSYSRAAVSLNLSQSALSRSIQSLERALGVDLVERGRGRSAVAFTDAGRDLIRRSQRLLRDVENIEQALKGSPAPVARISFGVGPTIGAMVIPRYLERVVGRAPAAAHSVVLGTSSALMRELLGGNIEFYVGYVPLGSDPRRFEQRTLGTRPIPRLWVRQGHPLLSGQTIRHSAARIFQFERVSTSAWLENLDALEDSERRLLMTPQFDINNHELLVDYVRRSDSVLISGANNESEGLVRLPFDLGDRRFTTDLFLVSVANVPLSTPAAEAAQLFEQIYQEQSESVTGST